ncbi:MAG: methyltransferase [Candidatus Aenigmarchaeota archaeon]|nr:methyltransferase [Candidatus Aenigmarchaeota archaeon]
MKMMVFEHRGMKISFCDGVYEPSDDSFLLLDVLEKETWSDTESVLEIGCGTGIASIFLCGNVKEVFSLDINVRAVACTKHNMANNRVLNSHVFSSDLFSAINSRKFDAIIFNTPYLPDDEDTEAFSDPIWSGGKDGRAVIDRFLKGALNHIAARGKIFIVESSLSGYQKTLDFFKARGFNAEVVARKKISFEEIVVIKAESKIYK